MASREIEIDAVPARPHAAALVADLLGGAGGDVARHQVAEARVAALQVVVALGLGDLVGGRVSPFFLGTQMRPSLRSDSLHQRQLRLVLAGDRDAGGVDLREAGVGEDAPLRWARQMAVPLEAFALVER